MSFRKLRFPGGLWLLALGMLLSISAPAQDRWFQVEIIVFERLDEDGVWAEAWQPDPGRPPVDESINLLAAADATGEETGTFAYRLLNPRSYSLKDSYGGLRYSKSFRPLLHYAWQQPALSQMLARWIHLYVPPDSAGGFAPAPPRLDGTLRVYLTRYLHVDTDLLYQREGSEIPVRLQASRRMRSGELHFLDHPLFGVLILVTPLGSTSG